MTQRQIKCNYCDNGQDILYDPNASPKTVNLDGSHHYHVKYGPSQQQSKQETVTRTEPVSRPMVTHEEESKITAALRSEAIAKAHEENMEASRNLTAAVNSLNSTISTFIDIVGKYLDSKR